MDASVSLGLSAAALLPLLLPGLDGRADNIGVSSENEKQPRKKRKTLNENPTCSRCKNDNVSNIGKHSDGKLVYRCNKEGNERGPGCEREWQQIPPVMLKPGQDPEEQECKPRPGKYKCKLCGQPKTYVNANDKKVSHNCPNKQDKVKRVKIVDTRPTDAGGNVTEMPPLANVPMPPQPTILKQSTTISTQTDDSGFDNDDTSTTFLSGNFPENPTLPGVYEEKGLSSQDFEELDFELCHTATLDVLKETCITCGDFGTYYAGDEKSFLKCSTCPKVIHYCCLDEFSEVWSCAECAV